MRLPNGYGNISKLPGKRRKPWRVRKTTGWKNIEGISKQQYITIGYYETRQDAIQALNRYNVSPYDIENTKLTLSEIYDQWSKKKFEEVSESNRKGYESAFKICEPLHNTRISDIRLSHIQRMADESGKAFPTLKKFKALMNQLFDYAVMNEIIPKDRHIIEHLNIGKEVKSTLHYRFTDAEIDKLWEWSSGNEYVQLILMLIYSGVRPGEMFALKREHVNIQDRYFTVEKGKTVNAARKVPIHSKTLPFFASWYTKNTPYLITNLSGAPFDFNNAHGAYTESFWIPVLKEIGIYEYINEKGETARHLPDDTRHTFTTLWKEKKLDEAFRRKIQGHSGKGIGEIVYTHLDLVKLSEELNKL